MGLHGKSLWAHALIRTTAWVYKAVVTASRFSIPTHCLDTVDVSELVVAAWSKSKTKVHDTVHASTAINKARAKTKVFRLCRKV